MTLSEYLEHSGLTQKAFAESIGVTQGLIAQWLSKKDPLPISPERARDIEAVTGGLVTRVELLPHVFGPIEQREQAA